MSANSQDNGTDDFVSITEMGRELEKGLSEILSKLDTLETDLKTRFDGIGSDIDKLTQETLDAAAAAEGTADNKDDNEDGGEEED